MRGEMGVGLRIFLVNDDDTIKRLPLVRYERLVRRDPQEIMPQYAGKRVRYAEVAVELEQRKPVEILRLQYFILPFDSEGRIDAAEREKEMRLAVDVLPPYTKDEDLGDVIDARHFFAKKRYDNEYRWRPTPEIEAEILRAIFGKELP